MPRLSFDKLRRSLAAGPPALAYYLHGSENVLKDEALALILDRALDAGTRDFNLDITSAQQLDPAELPAACATLPMMAEHRVVVVRDIEAWKRKSKAKQPAIEYLAHPMPETVLVMVQGNDDDADDDLAGHCTSVACNALTGEQLDSWLDGRLAKHGVSIDATAREHLIRATGGDLGMLGAEIDKLAGLDGSGPFGVEVVGALVGVKFGETPDDWRDAVLRDDTSKALTLLPKLLEQTGNSGVKLVTILGTSLLALRWARATAERTRSRDHALAGKIKTDLLFKVRPQIGNYDSISRLLAEVVGKWSLARLEAATALALQADMSLKNTTISDEGGIVTDLILALATSRAPSTTADRTRSSRSPVGALVTSIVIAMALAAPLRAQATLPPKSARFQEIVRLAQEGYGDSARTVIGKILASMPRTDSNYAEALYTAGTVANTGDAMHGYFARVVVEFPESGWADKAELRLAELSYGNGNMDDVVQRVTKLFAEYPGSPVIPTAALWGARAAFDQQKLRIACDWITRGIAAAGDDLEIRNQLQFAKQRCNVGPGVQLAPVVPESLRAGPPPTTAPTPPPAPPAPARTSKPVAAAASPWRIQVAAVSDKAVIDRLTRKLEAAGFTVYTSKAPKGLVRIQAGPFASRAAAAAKLSAVRAAGGAGAFVTPAP